MPHGGVLLFQVAQDAGIGASAACPSHHIVDTSLKVVIDLGACGFVMGQGIALVFKLSERDGSGDGLPDLCGLSDGSLHAILAGRVDDLCP